MKSKTLASFYSSFAVVLFLQINPASAQVTETFSYSIPSTQFPFTDNVTLPAFDTNLGTLQVVDLSLTADTTADVEIFNALPGSQPFTNAKASIATTITDPDGNTVSVPNVSTLGNGTAVTGLNSFPGIQSTGTDSIQISPSDFTAWESTSGPTVALDFTAEDGTFSGSAVSGVFFGGTAVVDASGTVTYTYDPKDLPLVVPEPSTWALLLGGLGLLAFWRFRTRGALN